MIGSFSVVAALLLGTAFAARGASPPVELIDPNIRFANKTLELPPQGFPILHTSFQYPPDCGETSYRGSGRLRGMKALITGGDSGIGRSIAIAFLREGAEVAINYLPSEEVDAQTLSDFVEQEGFSIERIPGDLANEAFCAELVTEAHRRLGGLDILVNHAGHAGNLQGPNWRPIHEFDTAELEQIYRVNVFAPLWLTRAAVPLLTPGGSIIVTSSGLNAHPVATSVLYGSSKAAVTHTIRSLAQQLLPLGIRVNGVAPPLTYTPFLATGGFTTQHIAAAAQNSLIGRLAQPAEVAPHYVDIADPTKTYMSGEVVAVLGGDAGF
ncbi:short-chain dehydrogenase/reductase SDR [Ilyonectria robusta]|uniref:short-chain dehydrogenase/reductase SDR n=1 Tax=Ilyonectria robusta TaxID=1079257 RepID=UPI001E8EB8FF|nr:short-chain dehydrogenase/reductase SDR [Ilyonectria robusta]KAH8706420.1 short-chain dehydrogenase/reductase SDR [Ilyonectria robusta]